MGRPGGWQEDEQAHQRLRGLGEAIRAARRERGVSQEKLALECGLDRTFISAIERGVRNPSLLSLYALADGLEIKIHDLFPPPRG